ncbi:putative baseplate assembly protein [Oculatella sp. LEGE 06141]|uniref:putative baseplate assembly protein n=1 Tax=Oculatella sp. LEGE 06141 TaxID=1828648 RepID=UPI0018810F2B|nr:putative baseplate assembly protein [Oculatella sp. LEGE 06141]MBE9180049.1 putative baseplate assembly protein [Oculatella sp. LEGE 06141]
MNNSCGCCEGIEALTPIQHGTPPGFDAIAYRVGTYATFLETMKARLSDHDYAGLAKLTTRASDDPAIALLDAWAVVADILTFYQERIANEGYLRTATERRSVLELARLVGYTLRPGVAASAYLAFTVDDGYTLELEAGIRAQTMPNPGEFPQSFETSESILVRAEWNSLKPRLARPQRLTPQTDVIYIQGTATRLNANDPILINPEDAALNVPLNHAAVAANGTTNGRISAALYRVETVVADQQSDRTAITVKPWQALPPDLTLPPAKTPVDLGELINKLAEPIPERAIPPQSRQRLGRSLASSFAESSDLNLQLLTQSQPALKPSLYRAWSQANVTSAVPIKVHALRLKAAPYGSTAPLRATPNEDGTVTHREWDLIESGEPISESFEITVIWQDDFSYGYATPFGVITTTIGISDFPVQTDQRSVQPETFVIEYSEADETIAVTTTISSRQSTFIRLQFSMRQRETSIVIDFDTQGQLYVTSEGTNPTTVIQAVSDLSTPARDVRLPGAGTHLLFDELSDASFAAARFTEQALVIQVRGSLQWVPSFRRTEQTDVVSMDAAYSQILPGSWVVLERPSDRDDRQKTMIIDRVKSVSDRARTDYGITAQSTQMQLHHDWLDFGGETGDRFDVIRDTTVFAHSEELELAPAPIDPIEEPICGNIIELDRLVPGLESGRWLIVTGERTDISGVSGVIDTELVMLAGVEQTFDPDLGNDHPHSVLHLGNDLAYCYKRDTVTIYGNVVRSTHGETRADVLGSGDGSQAMQHFTLPQLPLTHLAAPTAKGSKSTLQVSVNDIVWHETESLVYLGEDDRGYMTQTNAEGKTSAIFGNGKNGARLPTGLENVKAVYRTGIGKAGNAQAGQISLLLTRPLGLQAVTNPMRASGGADPESRDQARHNIPLAVMALDRLVSVPDYADFARTFAGIAKASAVSLSDGRRELVHLTIAGVDDAPIDVTSDLYRNFVEALHRLGDPYQPAQVDIRELMVLVMSAKVHLLPDYLWEGVEPQIRAALLDRFSFDQQELGEDVVPSHVIHTIQKVAGVAAVDLDVLGGIPEKLTDAATGKRRLLTPKEISAQVKQFIEQSAQQPKNQPLRVMVNLARAEAGVIVPAQIAFLNPNLPDTLILTRVEP